MKQLLIVIISFCAFFNVNAQIIIDNTAPYDNSTWLINNILISGGITPTNHSFIGDPMQIGFFNGVNSNLGIDSGIVLSSGNVLDLVGPNASGSTSTGITGSSGIGGDPTLNLVVGPLDYTNDAAVLEFDFVPTSNIISFKYVFGSEEYLEFVTSFNDAFGFFLSGPNPAGGMYVDQNLAIVPGTANTPVSIFNVNNVSNSTYYVDNGTGSTAPQNTDPTVIQFDGFTTPLTATADVNCGDTYHIKLVVADVNDDAWDSGVFLEAGSFYSPPLSIVDDLSIDSTYMSIPCSSTVVLTANGGSGATYQWFDASSVVFSTASSVTVGEGTYVVSADILGCAVLSDTLTVVEGDFPTFSFDPSLMIPCNSDTLISPIITGGTTPYTYQWFNASGTLIPGATDSMLNLGMGSYQLTVTDLYGCSGSDDLVITYDLPPSVDLGVDDTIACNTDVLVTPIINNGTAPYLYSWSGGETISDLNLGEGSYELTVTDLYGCTGSDDLEITYGAIPNTDISGGGSICNDGAMVNINFNFNGTRPWNLVFTDGNINYTTTNILSSNYTHTTNTAGSYEIVQADDVNNCIASNVGIADVIVNPLPIAVITTSESTIYENEEINLTAGTYTLYEWYATNDSLISTEEVLTVTDPGSFYVWVKDANGCEDFSEIAIVNMVPITQLFVPNTFTPNGDEHNELFVIKGMNIITYNLKVFNKWGEQLFESDSIEKYWDGKYNNKQVQQDAYYYNIEVLGKDREIFIKTGTVNVVY